MRKPIFIRPLTEDEQHQIQAGLRSSDAFVLRRCQILLASARGERAPAIAHQLGCDDQTVRNVIHGFNSTGLAVLQEGSSRPHRLRTTFSEEGCQRLHDLLHRSSARLWPRARSVDLGTGRPGQFRARTHCQSGFRRKRTPSAQTTENQLEACQALDYQSRPAVPAKKNARDRLIAWASQQPTWAIGFQDEVWWSRFALPRMHAWQRRGTSRAPGGTILAKE